MPAQLQYGFDVTWNLQRVWSTSVNVTWSAMFNVAARMIIIMLCHVKPEL